MLALILSAALAQQAAPAPIVWSEPAEPAPAETPAPPPPLPDWARADPYGYERSECSGFIRPAAESLTQCQTRVRGVLAAHLGDALPSGLKPAIAMDDCRQAANGDRYATQCGTPSRPDRPVTQMVERVCQTRPDGRGGWREECQPAAGASDSKSGLSINLGRRD